ncbi:MAG: hypothetical protein KAZ77_02335, partial [Acidovorax sp.]|nr:hypothetical protein [Acidovorax sp.]
MGMTFRTSSWLEGNAGAARTGKSVIGTISVKQLSELSFMRHYGEPSPPPSATNPAQKRSDWATLSRLLPYLWQYKWRVVLAIVFMV